MGWSVIKNSYHLNPPKKMTFEYLKHMISDFSTCIPFHNKIMLMAEIHQLIGRLSNWFMTGVLYIPGGDRRISEPSTVPS